MLEIKLNFDCSARLYYLLTEPYPQIFASPPPPHPQLPVCDVVVQLMRQLLSDLTSAGVVHEIEERAGDDSVVLDSVLVQPHSVPQPGDQLLGHKGIGEGLCMCRRRELS